MNTVDELAVVTLTKRIKAFHYLSNCTEGLRCCKRAAHTTRMYQLPSGSPADSKRATHGQACVKVYPLMAINDR
jgi:hypothetical protein